jgi:hypothetical protein
LDGRYENKRGTRYLVIKKGKKVNLDDSKNGLQ